MISRVTFFDNGFRWLACFLALCRDRRQEGLAVGALRQWRRSGGFVWCRENNQSSGLTGVPHENETVWHERTGAAGALLLGWDRCRHPRPSIPFSAAEPRVAGTMIGKELGGDTGALVGAALGARPVVQPRPIEATRTKLRSAAPSVPWAGLPSAKRRWQHGPADRRRHRWCRWLCHRSQDRGWS